jgi:mannose-6-phosphate isomerase-like protein (cupin superfamily)|tara:strand:- start:99070 stop:99462 length:393 start_codon:yes stop_codon:yes gene_type:complete
MINKTGKREMGWGYELIWASNEKYCGKIMVFTKKGAKFSMHFHKDKDETWFVNNGVFKLNWIDTKDATLYSQELKEGDSWHNPPCQPHQLVCMSNSGSVSEVSTPDHSDDNYRIVKGDSQKDSKNNPEKK